MKNPHRIPAVPGTELPRTLDKTILHEYDPSMGVENPLSSDMAVKITFKWLDLITEPIA
jgi:hypothetical protein